MAEERKKKKAPGVQARASWVSGTFSIQANSKRKTLAPVECDHSRDADEIGCQTGHTQRGRIWVGLDENSMAARICTHSH